VGHERRGKGKNMEEWVEEGAVYGMGESSAV
jgi:hypothetical protein